MRIAYVKLEESDFAAKEDGFKMILEQIFQEASIDIRHKCDEDPILAEFYNEEIQTIFYNNYSLLGAIFDRKAVPTMETHELAKEDFIGILQDSEIISREAQNNKKQVFNEHMVLVTIQNVSSFEQNKLNYVDFLECLVRLVPIYPFSDEDEK